MNKKFLDIKLISLTLVFFLGCTSEIDRSKELGFNSVWQMKKMHELGYKSRSDLIEKSPYNISSESSKFAEAVLGEEAEIFGNKKKSESGDDAWFETNNGVVLEANPRVISKIVFNCSGKLKIKVDASIDGVACVDSAEQIKEKLKSYKMLCTTSYLDIDTYYIIKNKAYFQINTTKRFGNELISMGLVDESKSLDNRHEDPYIECEEAKSIIANAKSQGFSSVYEMRVAEEKRKNPLKYCKSDWTACTTTKMLVNNYEEFESISEKCESATIRLAKWDVDFGLNKSFNTFYDSETDIKEGRIILTENNVKFQNGFGAWRRVPVVCYYNLKNKTAVVTEKF